MKNTSHNKAKPSAWTPKPLPTLKLPRGGFDRLLFSAPQVYDAPKSIPQLFLPKSLGPFKRQEDRALPSHPSYSRRAAYATPDETTFMEIFYRPRYTPRPLFQVQFRACMRCLLNLRVVEQAINELAVFISLLPDLDERYLFLFCLTLSEVEFTLDFPGGYARELRRSLLTPWSRQHYALELDGTPGRRGSRRSRIGFRVYEKCEEGISVARVEWVIRRAQLQRWGVNAIADLRRVPWTDHVLRRIQFVDFHPSRKNRRAPQWAYRGQVRVAGPAWTLLNHSPKNRLWLRRRLRPNTLHAQAEAALRTFEAELSLATRKTSEDERR